MRNTWRHTSYVVICRDCSFKIESVNGLGLAAQHHDKYNHSIDVDVLGSVSYLTDADHAARQAKQ